MEFFLSDPTSYASVSAQGELVTGEQARVDISTPLRVGPHWRLVQGDWNQDDTVLVIRKGRTNIIVGKVEYNG